MLAEMLVVINRMRDPDKLGMLLGACIRRFYDLILEAGDNPESARRRIGGVFSNTLEYLEEVENRDVR